MADTEVEQINETDLSAKLNGNVHVGTEQVQQSNEARKTSKMIDKNEQNLGSILNSDKSHVENSKSLTNSSNDGEDDAISDSKYESETNNKDCKSDNSIIEDNQTLNSENATVNSDDLCDIGNSCNGTKETNRNDNEEQMDIDRVEEQKAVDDEQMDEDNENEEDRTKNDTESRSNEIKKSLEDSRISLDKSVTIVKVPDPKQQSSGSSGKKKNEKFTRYNFNST